MTEPWNPITDPAPQPLPPYPSLRGPRPGDDEQPGRVSHATLS